MVGRSLFNRFVLSRGKFIAIGSPEGNFSQVFRRILPESVHFIGSEHALRVTDVPTIAFHIFLTVDQLNQLFLVVGEAQVGVPGEISVHNVFGAQGDFYPSVPGFANIVDNKWITKNGRQGTFHQQTTRVGIVEINGTGDTVVEHTKVQSDVALRCAFPGYRRIAHQVRQERNGRRGAEYVVIHGKRPS